jgi:hypothetical protein
MESSEHLTKNERIWGIRFESTHSEVKMGNRVQINYANDNGMPDGGHDS